MATRIATIDSKQDANLNVSAPPATPSNVTIYVPGKDLPNWISERMTTGEIGADNRFEFDASDGRIVVEPGFAIFQALDQVFACRPQQVQEKLSRAAGSDNNVVVSLIQRTSNMREQKAAQRTAARQAPLVKATGEKPLKLKPMIGVPPSPQFVAVETLLVDDTYQRSIEGGSSQKLIVKIAENWDWRLCLPLLVSRRDGRLYVIDGQHRLEAAKLRGDIAHMPVVVFDFDDPKAEAELFVQANRSRRQMSKLDDFHAAVVAGDLKAVATDEVVTSAGLTVGRIQAWQYWKPGEVVFVTAIQRALHSQGKAVVEQALRIIARAFDGLVLVGVGAIFEALCTLMQEREKQGAPVDAHLMGRVLSEVGIPGWKEAVEGVDSGQERAEVMLRALEAAYAEVEAE